MGKKFLDNNWDLMAGWTVISEHNLPILVVANILHQPSCVNKIASMKSHYEQNTHNFILRDIALWRMNWNLYNEGTQGTVIL